MSNQYKDTPSVIMEAEVKQAKNGGKYVWCKTFDLQKIIEKTGRYVYLKMTFPRNPKFDGQRLFIFSQSDRNMSSAGKATNNVYKAVDNDGDIVV